MLVSSGGRGIYPGLGLMAVISAAVCLQWPDEPTAATPSALSVKDNGRNTFPVAGVDTIMRSPLAFEINQGQFSPEVHYLARGSAYAISFSPDGAVLSLHTANSDSMLQMSLLGSNPNPRISGMNQLPAKHHYFIGKDATHWHTNIPTFAKVNYQNVYSGIDLVYYGKEGELEYDFVVAPGADPETIRLAFHGADDIRLNRNGDLILHTPAGDVIHRAPYVYQEEYGVRKQIPAHYRLLNAGADEKNLAAKSVGFQLAQYDPDKPLIIDPALAYSSYLGGSSTDEARAIAVDAAGNVYVAGGTLSANLPGNNGLYAPRTDPSYNSIDNSPSDAFVSKYDSTGALLFTVYLGSDGFWGDAGNGIAVGSDGLIYVTGHADSGSATSFPVTAGAYDTTGNGITDVFVAVLESDGSALRYSTLLGGGYGDRGNAIAVDAAGDVYVTGWTLKSTTTPFPIKNAVQAASGGGYDAFVAKLHPARTGASDLVYSTYLGGSGTDKGNSIAVDASGYAYVAGTTDSTNFPVASPYQAALKGGTDAFVARLAPDGNSLGYATYLGGSGNETGGGIAVDAAGNAYVAGQTASADYPKAAPFDSSLGGTTDAFVTKLNSAGNALTYSTYLGGSGDEEGRAIGVDGAGNAYVTGWTTSVDFFQGTFTCSLDTLASGASATVNLDMRLDTALTVNVTANVTANEYDGSSADNTSTATTTAGQSANGSGGPVIVGGGSGGSSGGGGGGVAGLFELILVVLVFFYRFARSCYLSPRPDDKLLSSMHV